MTDDKAREDNEAGEPTEATTDAEQTRKDRAYSPGSERETERLQRVQSTAQVGDVDDAGVEQLPGTGGPDDSGDTSVPNDHIDARVIIERSDPGV
ncbi:MAG: hypothetical protein JWP70_185 [Leifsonia sp.]|jgi:hypothetical protein|nr:hypothetical protein [Leifsonia sp.]MDQ1589362.1 hypothetical protein [Microbacteriaceae bacterium]HEV7565196.1 hypothetical protein [Microbacteriaceae bacterium]